jgi:hypothetical protein
MKPTVIIIETYLLHQLHTYFDPIPTLNGDKITGNHQRGFRRNRSTTDEMFCILQILENKLKHSETVHQVFIDFKKAQDPVIREILYNILIVFWVRMK